MSAPDLASLRDRIEAVDRQIIQLIGERLSIVENVAEAKLASASPFRDRQREEALIGRLRELATQAGVDPHQIERMYRVIMDMSVARQEAAVRERYGSRRIRMRSSSNAEDLPGFNGAGLYTSEGMALDTEGDSLEDSLRVVWASLYGQRAHDERQLANIDHRQVAMAVLVHEAYRSERAQGVGVSRNVLDRQFTLQIGAKNLWSCADCSSLTNSCNHSLFGRHRKAYQSPQRVKLE
jgi:chorismate mutase